MTLGAPCGVFTNIAWTVWRDGAALRQFRAGQQCKPVEAVSRHSPRRPESSRRFTAFTLRCLNYQLFSPALGGCDRDVTRI
jgi:hypothetical protein